MMVQSINLQIDYVPVKKHDELKKHCIILQKRITELEEAKTIGIQACDLLKERIEELEAEIQEVANQLMDLYTKCSETTEPEVFGTILGLHERLEKAKDGKSTFTKKTRLTVKPIECKTCWYSCEVKNISECPLIKKAKDGKA